MPDAQETVTAPVSSPDPSPVSPPASTPASPPGSSPGPLPGRAGVTLEAMKEVIKVSPYSSWTGTRIIACKDGYAEFEVPFRPEFGQHHGFLHGGIIGFMVDTASAWAAASVAGDVVTAQFSVNMLAPGIGETFIARGQVIKAGRRQIVTRADVYSRNGTKEKLIATGTGLIMPV